MSERRQVPRYLFDQPAYLSLGPAGPTLKARLQIISLLGCGAEGESVPATGQKCEVRFEWRGRELRTDAVVVWKTPAGRAGMKFLTVDENTLQFLRQLCATLPLEHLEPLPVEPEKEI